MADITIDELKRMLQVPGVGLPALKKKVDEEIVPTLNRLCSERSTFKGQANQILSQAGVSSVEEFKQKALEAVQKCVSEYESTKAVVDKVVEQLQELERKRAELNGSPVAQ